MYKTPQTDAWWARYRAANPQAPPDYRLIWFGGGDLALADELANLVVNGPKRATTWLLRDLETGKEAYMPQPGELWLLLDGKATPRAVLRTHSIDIRPFRDVDRQFAWDEGEGDRSLADWRRAHLRYFRRQAGQDGFVFDESMSVVLERFRVIWPPEAADGSHGCGREVGRRGRRPGGRNSALSKSG
jgi:uncharacterized protein YhfF